MWIRLQFIVWRRWGWVGAHTHMGEWWGTSTIVPSRSRLSLILLSTIIRQAILVAVHSVPSSLLYVQNANDIGTGRTSPQLRSWHRNEDLLLKSCCEKASLQPPRQAVRRSIGRSVACQMTALHKSSWLHDGNDSKSNVVYDVFIRKWF